MTEQMNRAISCLQTEDVSCVVMRTDGAHTAKALGVKPLLGFLETDSRFFEGAAVADKVIGKAAALLLVLGGAAEVYGAVMSESAVAVLDRFGIPHSCQTLVPRILNRQGTGLCPLEASVTQVEQPEEAIPALKAAIAVLMAGKQK